MKFALPQEIETSVEELLNKQNEERIFLEIKEIEREQKRREANIATAKRLIEEVENLTGLKCEIDEESIEEEFPGILFRYDEWKVILAFSLAERGDSINAGYVLKDLAIEPFVSVLKQDLKAWCIEKLALAKRSYFI